MLYVSVILCIRQCFIIVSVYTIHGTDILYIFLYYMFHLSGAIFRYIRSHSHLFLFLLLPTLASVYTLGVRCMYGFYMMPCVVKFIKY
jgi:hypothetical protein